MVNVPKISYVNSFLSVAKENSFTIAAKQLGTSKTVISRNVQLLEKELGVVLVNRTQRGVCLSAEGRFFKQEAQQILENYERLIQSIRKRENDIAGSFRLMLPRNLSETRLLSALSSFSLQYKDLQLVFDFSDERKQLTKTGYDAAIRSGSLTADDQDLIAKPLSNDKIILCASKEYIDRFQSPINSFSDLNDCDFIKDTNLKNETLDKVFENHSFRDNIKVEANSSFFTKHALLNNSGIGFIPSKFVEQELKEGKLIELLSRNNFGSIGLWVVYLKEYRNSKKIKSLVETLRSYLQ